MFEKGLMLYEALHSSFHVELVQQLFFQAGNRTFTLD